jgi:hypothetical protein
METLHSRGPAFACLLVAPCRAYALAGLPSRLVPPRRRRKVVLTSEGFNLSQTFVLVEARLRALRSGAAAFASPVIGPHRYSGLAGLPSRSSF